MSVFTADGAEEGPMTIGCRAFHILGAPGWSNFFCFVRDCWVTTAAIAEVWNRSPFEPSDTLRAETEAETEPRGGRLEPFCTTNAADADADAGAGDMDAKTLPRDPIWSRESLTASEPRAVPGTLPNAEAVVDSLPPSPPTAPPPVNIAAVAAAACRATS